MKPEWIVYRITQRHTCQLYIGCTRVGVSARVQSHINTELSLVGKAIREHGLKQFTIEEVHKFDNARAALAKEEELIAIYAAEAPRLLYNRRFGGAIQRSSRPELRGREVEPSSTALDRYLIRNKIGDTAFAALLRLSYVGARKYVWRWRKGHCRPNDQTMVKIEKLTGGEVPVRSWFAPERRGR